MESAHASNNTEDYKDHASLFKDEADEAFRKQDFDKSIHLYTQAIELDPDNHVLFSNRSAAYMKVDSKSKALKDAEKVVELAPKWIKGYSRLGVAQQSLKRFDAAMQSFKKGIEMEASNQYLWTALRECQEACESDKKERFINAEKERAEEERRLQLINEAKIAAQAHNTKQKSEDLLSDFFNVINVPETPKLPPEIIEHHATDDNDKMAEKNLLEGFFSQIAESTTKTKELKSNEPTKILNEKYTNQDLGDGRSQYWRIMQRNYVWKNLNPYNVLQLDIDATVEDIKHRYKKLSTKVHPDKLRDMEQARECFEEVKTAYLKLMDEKARNIVVMNIEYIREEAATERRRLLAKGVKENALPPLEDEMDKRLMKHFAEIEMQSRRSETNLRFYNARERIQEDSDKARLREDMEKEKAWADVERRESRVSDWREFEENPEAKKVRLASYKEERRAEGKHGVVKMEDWKKSWK